ncbi:PstC family ABC transporter permease [Streptomyces sp. GTA36]
MTSPTLGRQAASGGPGFLKRSQPRYGEKAIKVLLVAASLVSVLTTIGIVIALIPPAADFFGKVNFGDFISGTNWAPLFKPPHFGVIPLVTGTLMVTLIALLVSVPLGLGAAVYLSEYAHPRVRTVFKPILEVLAGIPTVVYGFFALKAITPLLQDIWPVGQIRRRCSTPCRPASSWAS